MDTSQLETDIGALDSIVGGLLGDPATFFGEYWRRKPRYAPEVARNCAGMYGVDQFLADMVETQSAPYICVSARDGRRFFSKHATAEELRSAVLAGGISAIKASRVWHGATPASWIWMRTLFGRLCRHVAMLYMSPARSEDVDIFLAGPQSGLGTHFDTTDVFTVQLWGERKWTVDKDLHLDNILHLTREPGWYPAREIDFQSATCEFTLRPGDGLYVPAYSVHRVEGVSWSVSLSLGLRAFNEIDFVEHLLEAIRLTGYANYPPVSSFAESLGECHVEAKLELMRRIRSLLSELEGMSLTSLMSPLTIPTVLESPTSESSSSESTPAVLGMFTSGFALEE